MGMTKRELVAALATYADDELVLIECDVRTIGRALSVVGGEGEVSLGIERVAPT